MQGACCRTPGFTTRLHNDDSTLTARRTSSSATGRWTRPHTILRNEIPLRRCARSGSGYHNALGSAIDACCQTPGFTTRLHNDDSTSTARRTSSCATGRWTRPHTILRNEIPLRRRARSRCTCSKRTASLEMGAVMRKAGRGNRSRAIDWSAEDDSLVFCARLLGILW